MILVMLQLESEFPRTDWTPSQVSTLEPLLGTLLGSLWCPPNHISLNFPIWGSCAWFMNQRIHVFSMKIDWFQVVSGALMVWAWLLLVLDWMGGEERSDNWLKLFSFLSHPSQLYVTWEMMGFQLVEKGFIPWWTRVYFLIWLDKLGPDGKGLQLFNCCWNLANQFTCFPIAEICVWASLTQLGFSNKLAWVGLTLQDE